MAVLVVMAVLFASCSNGLKDSEGEGGASAQKVMVSLGFDIEGEYIQKDISVDDFNLNGLTVWYKAVPQWSQARPISGDTRRKGDANDFVQIPNFRSGQSVSLGAFTAGVWQFDVEVRKDSDVIYDGTSGLYSIYDGHAAVEITVNPKQGDGTVTIEVSIPTTGDFTDPQQPEYHERMAISYTGTTGGSVNVPTINPPDRGVQNRLTTYTTAPLPLAAGAYTFTFLYYDESTAQNGGASVAVNVVAGKTATITGLIENGKWHQTGMIITVPGVTCAVAPTDGQDHPYLAPSSSLEYTCTATSVNNNLSYAWFVNGVDQQRAATTFTFNNSKDADYGIYEITCVVTDGNARAYARQWVEVTNTITVSTANVTSNKAHATTGEIVTLRPAAHYAISAVTVSPAETAYPVVGGYAFHMPNAAATITATVAGTKAITLPEHALFTLPDAVQAANSNEAPAAVTVTLKPAKGYHFDGAPTVNGGAVEVTPAGNGYTFTMPAEAVTVTGTPVAD